MPEIKKYLKNLNRYFYRFCQIVIMVVMLVTAGFLAVYNLIYTSRVKYVWTEDIVQGRTSWNAVLTAAVLFLIFLILGRNLEQLKEKHLFLFFAGLYLAAGIYWVVNASTGVRLDTASVQSAAHKLLEGNFEFLKPGQYIYSNEHQLGIVTYEYLLGRISTSMRFQYFMNLLEIIGINFASWRLANLCFGGNHRTNLYTILFTFLFLPQFFFLAFSYGITPGLFFLMYAILFMQKYFAEGKWYFGALCIVSLIFAVLIKGNNMIGAVAIAILFFMQSVKEKKARYLLFMLLTLFFAGTAGKGIGMIYEHASGMELSGGKPMILYIAMGTEPNNQKDNAPGGYNGYVDWAFDSAGYDPDKAAEIAKNTLKDTVFTFQEHPDWMVSYFARKIQTVWCEPMYQSIWSGPLPDAGTYHRTDFLNELYSGRSVEPYIALYMKGFVILTFVLAAISAARQRNKYFSCDYIYLYFIGGFLLHIIWEAKSQYVYPYVFILMPVCAHEMGAVSEKVWQYVKRKMA